MGNMGHRAAFSYPLRSCLSPAVECACADTVFSAVSGPLSDSESGPLSDSEPDTESTLHCTYLLWIHLPWVPGPGAGRGMPRRWEDVERPSVAEPLLAAAGAPEQRANPEKRGPVDSKIGPGFSTSELLRCHVEAGAIRRREESSEEPSRAPKVAEAEKGGGVGRGESAGSATSSASEHWHCGGEGHHSRLKYYRTLCSKLLHTRLDIEADMCLAVPPPHITPPQQYHETTPLPLVLNHGEQLVWRGQHDGQGERGTGGWCARMCGRRRRVCICLGSEWRGGLARVFTIVNVMLGSSLLVIPWAFSGR